MKKIAILSLLVLAAAQCLAGPFKDSKLNSEVTKRLCPLFTDNMVMQQQRDNAPIWGQAKPNKKVTVITSWNAKKYTTTAATDGKWRIEVSTPKAGGPYSITIDDGTKTVLNNVMIGEVWLCSGQSNMGFELASSNNAEEEIADANNHPNIRLLKVKTNIAPEPLDGFDTSIGNGWNVCSGDAAKHFTAVGYFYGRNLEQNLNVPIGLIDASWGGTIIEAWTSLEGLSVQPSQARNIEYVKHLPAEASARDAQYQKEIVEWGDKVRSIDAGYDNNQPVYASSSFDDSAWGKINYERGVTREPKDILGIDGFFWLRRVVDVPAEYAGKDLYIHMGGIDDNDITFFNGEQIGSMEGVIYRRDYTIPGNLVKAGRNMLTVRVQDTGGFGGFYPADDTFYITDSKESTEHVIDLVGEWRYHIGCSTMELPVMPVNTAGEPNVHSFLYNSMIHPLRDYALKGAIWYQGESNSDQSLQYRELQPMLIKDWRRQWHDNFPFFIVQLANYKQRLDEPSESSWAELREAQYLTAKHLENTGMACIIDIGEANDIHPKNKQDVGYRLALQSRAIAYGEKINPNGPQYRDYRIEGNKIRVFFDGENQSGESQLVTGNERLNIPGGEVKGFTICGPDRVFHWADAVIEGNSIVVSSPDVQFPVAVRYAWGDNPECNLYNQDGLPAIPFRTDDYPNIGILVR